MIASNLVRGLRLVLAIAAAASAVPQTVPAQALETSSQSKAAAQSVLFDFDGAPPGASLPIELTVGGLTARFSATGQGFSFQSADVLGFTPAGFGGLCIYPNSIDAADLLVSFSQAIQDLSILYAPEEYGCDSSALMRVTGYLNGAFVATNTTTAPNPGTWPTGVLTLSAPRGFNSVVIHYESPPPTGGDWGPIFMADNMTVTPATLVRRARGRLP
jgi:hypothetical protein